MKKKINNWLSNIKKQLQRLINKLKKIFANKRNILILIICFIILLAIILTIVIINNRRNRFALNHIYELLPYEVKEIYSNLVGVSCYGDLHFDIEVDSGEKKIADINKNNLIDYMFSYLDKHDLLSNKIDESTIKKVERELFINNLNLIDNIKDYGYGNYTYSNQKGKFVREKRECNSDIKYVSHLFGYSYKNNELLMDVNVAYLKDGMLYNFKDEELGKYDGDASKLPELTKKTSFYRLKYIKTNGLYKLAGVQWISRG